MTYQSIRWTVSEGVGVLTLNAPETMNALSSRMRIEIREALERAADEARVVVMTGEGRAFCSGQNLTEAGAGGLDVGRTLREEYEPMLRAIADTPLPVIAAVNGVAAGAGANLALAADVVIAAESAVFLQAFTRIGLIPDAGGTYFLPRQVGFARAMGAMLFAEPVPARRAADWGMIWEAVPDADFAAHWQTRAAQLAQGPGVAYASVKKALRESLGNGFDTQLAREAELQSLCGHTADFAEGVAAFLEKRKPRFSGR